MATRHYIIGAGISGIMTALRMQESGCDPVIISSTADPRTGIFVNLTSEGGHAASNSTNLISKESGSSYGGGPTRMATPTEGDVYLGSGNPIYPDVYKKFQKTVAQGGWLDKDISQLVPVEKEWLETRGQFDVENDYIESLRDFYVNVNRAGVTGWLELNDKIPELFKDADFTSGVIRTYDDKTDMQYSAGAYGRFNELTGYCPKENMEEEFPYLSSDDLEGVMGLRGCSLNIHKFMANALDYLEKNGAELQFNTSLNDLEVSEDGVVEALVLQRGDSVYEDVILNPESVSLHMGAYDKNGIYNKTPAQDKIMGVAGLWLRIEKPEGMDHAMKVHIRESADGQKPLVDLNLIPCGEHMLVGGGYVFTGNTPEQMTEESKRETYDGMIYALQRSLKGIEESDIEILENAMCSRSFTYDELPLLGSMPTSGGGQLILVGGDNTGTTSMAPAMSELVRDIALDLDGESSDLKEHYDYLEAYSAWVMSGKDPSMDPDAPEIQDEGADLDFDLG